jgi:hypothetical protein
MNGQSMNTKLIMMDMVFIKINNIYFDRLVGKIRSKSTHLIHTSESSALIEHNASIGKKGCMAL